jgi:LmbE family N-acetylglucosaminyl deacetylase
MKKIVLILAIAVSLCATKTQAQNMQRMQEAWKSYLKDTVKLSDALSDSVMAIRSDFRPQMRDIFMDQSSSADDKRTKMEALRSQMDVRYKSAGLTDDQVAAIHQHEEEMRARMMNRNGGGGGQ